MTTLVTGILLRLKGRLVKKLWSLFAMYRVPFNSKFISLGLFLTLVAHQSVGNAASPNPVAQTSLPGGMMTRDELRACFKAEKSIDVKAKEVDQRSTDLQAEKERIAQATANLEALQGDLGKQRQALTTSDNTVRENAKKLQGWNQELHRIAAAPDSVPVATRKKIESDYADLSAQNKKVMAERDQIYRKYGDGAKQYNAQAASLEKQINSWNVQNKKFDAEAAALVKMRTDYASGCTNRPFLEADRAAVKAGQ